jgi:predicted ATPase
MPKDCTYLSEVSQTLHSDDQLDGDTLVNHVFQSQEATDSREALVQLAEASKRTDAALSQTNDSLAEVYGYVEYSQSNTMALLRRVSGHSYSSSDMQRALLY